MYINEQSIVDFVKDQISEKIVEMVLIYLSVNINHLKIDDR